MNQLTPSTARESLVSAARDRVSRLQSMAQPTDAVDIELRLATVILVAEILRDIEVLVTEPVFQKRKLKLHAALARVSTCKDSNRLAGIVDAFCADANRILPFNRAFDPDNPPW